MAKKQKVEEILLTDNVDEIAADIMDSINKQFKDLPDKAANFADNSMSEVTEWISTGSTMLDLAISNRPHGGWPVGRITEIFGGEACVTEDTTVKIKLALCYPPIPTPIKTIKDLIISGTPVWIESKDGYSPVTDYYEKGNLETFLVKLRNGNSIKVSAAHRFWGLFGWVEAQNLVVGSSAILCDDGKYWKVDSIEYIGIQKIVDITVDHPDQCYFGNGMLNHNSGKSLLAAYAIKSTQQKGGVAILFDTEYAVSKEYLTAIGVDVSKLVIVNLSKLEDIFESIDKIIERVRRSNRNKIVTVIVDSIMGATTEKEMMGDYDQQGWNTSKSIILSQAMRKITPIIGREKICLLLINQIRTNLGVTFGDNSTTSGGKAIPFHSSVRVFLKSMGKLEGEINGTKTPVGMKTRAIIKKNRLGPPLRTTEYDIYFDRGIDDYSSWGEVLKSMGLLKPIGHSVIYEYIDTETGEVTTLPKFKLSELEQVLADKPEIKKQMYQLICENYIMKYNTSQNLETSFNSEDEY